jgi:hypothetical protein
MPSPQTSTTGPYEVRGTWNLQLKGSSGKANFEAALNMVLSDGWVLTLGDGNFDPNGRGAHTQHITIADYGRISGKWYGHGYPQWKPRAHFSYIFGSRHYGWHHRQIFQCRIDFRDAGLNAFWNRASPRHSSETLRAKVVVPGGWRLWPIRIPWN